MFDLIAPFPDTWLPNLWEWVNEHPASNLDDYGPQTIEAFVTEMRGRGEREFTWAVLQNGRPVGCVGYLPLTPRLGTFHGICFSRSVGQRELKLQALQRIIGELFDSGVEKICASFFSDNLRIAVFLSDLGFHGEGLLKKHTLRNGQPVDMTMVALFKEAV